MNSDFKTTLRCCLYVYVSRPIAHIGEVIQMKQVVFVYLGLCVYIYVYIHTSYIYISTYIWKERAKGNA